MVQNNDKLNSLRLYKSIISRSVEYAASFDSLLKRVSPPAIKTCQGDLAILVLAENNYGHFELLNHLRSPKYSTTVCWYLLCCSLNQLCSYHSHLIVAFPHLIITMTIASPIINHY